MNFKFVRVTWGKWISLSLNRVFLFEDFQSFSVMKNIDVPMKENALWLQQWNSTGALFKFLTGSTLPALYDIPSCLYLLLINFRYLKYTYTLGIVTSHRGNLLSDKNSCATSVKKEKRVLNLFSELNVNFFLHSFKCWQFQIRVMSLSFHTLCHKISRFSIFYWVCKAHL